jgi:hypothetical protein
MAFNPIGLFQETSSLRRSVSAPSVLNQSLIEPIAHTAAPAETLSLKRSASFPVLTSLPLKQNHTQEDTAVDLVRLPDSRVADLNVFRRSAQDIGFSQQSVSIVIDGLWNEVNNVEEILNSVGLSTQGFLALWRRAVVPVQQLETMQQVTPVEMAHNDEQVADSSESSLEGARVEIIDEENHALQGASDGEDSAASFEDILEVAFLFAVGDMTLHFEYSDRSTSSGSTDEFEIHTPANE